MNEQPYCNPGLDVVVLLPASTGAHPSHLTGVHVICSTVVQLSVNSTFILPTQLVKYSHLNFTLIDWGGYVMDMDISQASRSQ